MLLPIRFSAKDGNNGVAAADVSINLCNCSDHGECLFDLLADGYELKQTFRIVQCNCSTGWEGKEFYATVNHADVLTQTLIHILSHTVTHILT